jgi:hypothetical protein
MVRSAASAQPPVSWPWAGLALYDVLGWWWADRVAALVVAAIAAALAWRTAPHWR